MRFILDYFAGPKDYDGPPMPLPGKAVYQSPSGDKIPFDFEDVSSGYDTRSAPFESATGDGTYVQPGGHSSARLPMRAFFHGEGYDTRAEAFLKAVLERGEGVLTHPQYRKPINVVPVGNIDRFDGYKSGTNQTIFTLTFFETTGLLLGAKKDLQQSFDSLLDASAADFANNIRVSDPVDKTSFINQVKAVAKAIEVGMKRASQGLEAATQGVEDIGDSINRGIDILIGAPLTMARQIQILIGEPARQAESVKAKLAGYNDLAASIFGSADAEQSSYSNESINNLHLNLLVSRTITGNYATLAEAGSSEYVTKADYIEQAEALQALLDNYQAWSDNNFQAIGVNYIDQPSTDVGGGVLDLQELVALAISRLITGSFDAKSQVSFFLDSERTPLDLCFNLYGTADNDTFDLFKLSNNIVGDEHFLIPKGRQVVYYV